MEPAGRIDIELGGAVARVSLQADSHPAGKASPRRSGANPRMRYLRRGAAAVLPMALLVFTVILATGCAQGEKNLLRAGNAETTSLPNSALTSVPSGSVQLLEHVPVIAYDEVESLEVRPGEPRWQEATGSYATADRQDLVILHLTRDRELRFTVRLDEIESLGFIPTAYRDGEGQAVGLLVNFALDRTLRELYTTVAAPPDIQAYLNDVRQGLQAQGLEVLGVRAESVEPLSVTVILPSRLVHSPEGVFVFHQVQRAVARVQADGAPIEMVLEMVRDESGQELENMMYRVSQVPISTGSFPSDEVRRQVDDLALGVAEGKGIRVDAVQVTDEAGLVVTVRATGEGGPQNVRLFVGEVQARVDSLSKEKGSGVVALRMAIDNEAGEPLLRKVDDFQLGWSSWWGGGPPGYRPGWQ